MAVPCSCSRQSAASAMWPANKTSMAQTSSTIATEFCSPPALSSTPLAGLAANSWQPRSTRQPGKGDGFSYSSREGYVAPLGKFTSHQIELCLDALNGVGAQLQAQRWLGDLGDVNDGFRRLHRIAWLAAVVRSQRLAHRPRTGEVVSDGGRFDLHARAAEEVGAKPARLHDRDVYAERGQLVVQRLGYALKGELGRAVQARRRNGREAAHGADVQDVSGALGPQCRQCRPQRVEHAEDVDVEQRPGSLVGDLLDRADEAVAGVVDHDVDPAESGQAGLHRSHQLLWFGHVRGHH